jgi:hypothetical protein
MLASGRLPTEVPAVLMPSFKFCAITKIMTVNRVIMRTRLALGLRLARRPEMVQVDEWLDQITVHFTLHDKSR